MIVDFDNKNQSLLENEKVESALEHSGYAKNKLNQLQERLNNKSQALQVSLFVCLGNITLTTQLL